MARCNTCDIAILQRIGMARCNTCDIAILQRTYDRALFRSKGNDVFRYTGRRTELQTHKVNRKSESLAITMEQLCCIRSHTNRSFRVSSFYWRNLRRLFVCVIVIGMGDKWWR